MSRWPRIIYTLELEQRLSLAEWEFITFAELIIADRSRNTGGVNVLFGQLQWMQEPISQ
jgi:hypothetical protein